jgi:hypothetical protein
MYVYYKYAETKLILIVNVIPLDFNAPVPAFHKFSNSVKEKSFFVASLTNFAPLQFYSASSPQIKHGRIITNRRVKLRV